MKPVVYDLPQFENLRVTAPPRTQYLLEEIFEESGGQP